MDEEETARSYNMFDEDENHVENCSCAYPVECEGCGAEITDGYEDYDCKVKREVNENESDPALD
jgi:hypothetical protein